MTQDEIIEMARQAGLSLASDKPYDLHGLQSQLFEFAKLVAAKEREACAKLVEAFEPDDKDLAMAIRARGEA